MATLLMAQQQGYSAEDLCSPALAFSIVAEARVELDPWTGDHDLRVRRVLDRAADVERLASLVMCHPASSWWAAPLDRHAQVSVAGDRSRSTREPRMIVSSAYAQRPLQALITSTRVGGKICWDALAARHIGDEEPFPSPSRSLLSIATAARVYDVHSPEAWHRLAMQFPLTDDREQRPPGGLAPDWAAVASVWDAVHLSFFGFLASAFVSVGTGLTRSKMWAWEGEQTVWLRDVFTTSTEMTVDTEGDEARTTPASLRELWDWRRSSPERMPLIADE